MKKIGSALLALALIGSMAGCSSTSSGSQSAQASSGSTSAAAQNVAMADLTISGCTGNPDVFAEDIAAMLQEEYPDLNVDYVICDTNTREQSQKTAISAGDPPTLGTYWGTRVNSFYDNGMCLDLRDYLSEETLAKINESMLEPCLGPNGEVYAVPLSTVYHTMFYNKDMMDEYGFEEPKTWDDLTEIFARLKEDDIFGFAMNSASMQDCLYGITYPELDAKVGEGTAYGVASGEVSVAPGSEAGEVIRDCIELVQGWYDEGYWYPGDGGISCTADDANAAFAQGRCMFIFNFSGAYSTHVNSCDFEIGTCMKPTSSEDIDPMENIEPTVYFIPSNCSEEQIQTAVAFLELALSPEGQQAVVDSGNLPAVTDATYDGVSEIVQELMGNMDAGYVQAGLNPTRTSSEMQTFIKQQIFAAPCGGVMTIDETLNEMERIRLEAIGG